VEDEDRRKDIQAPGLKKVPVEEAVGLTVLHDMTRIVPGQEKGPAFKRDHRISAGDLCRLQQMGRKNIYAADAELEGSEWIHEDKAALAFARAMAGEGAAFSEKPSEGKADLLAARDGLLVVEEKALEAFNTLPGVMCASRHNYSVVNRDSKIGGTRAIPLYLSLQDFERALQVLQGGPLFKVLAFRRSRVGVLVTGTEVFQGLIKDSFIPIIRHKVKRFGCQVVEALIVPDEKEAIADGVGKILKAGADLIVTTAGLSVDPDDVTRQGLVEAGVTHMLYGMPILPGAMTLIARTGDVRVIGVPACALFHSITSFDILLPRLLADLPITRSDLARLGNGGLCLGCKACTFPKCPFGK
jgi:formylmethanofuran dehydrogenase subunit E